MFMMFLVDAMFHWDHGVTEAQWIPLSALDTAGLSTWACKIISTAAPPDASAYVHKRASPASSRASSSAKQGQGGMKRSKKTAPSIEEPKQAKLEAFFGSPK